MCKECFGCKRFKKCRRLSDCFIFASFLWKKFPEFQSWVCFAERCCSLDVWVGSIAIRWNYCRQVWEKELLDKVCDRGFGLRPIRPFDGFRHYVNLKLLPWSILLRSQSISFWNLLRTCDHYDPKHISFEPTRKCNFDLLFLYHNRINNCPSPFWSNSKLNWMLNNSSTIRSTDHSVRWVKLLGLSPLLVQSWQSLQIIYGRKRCKG